MRRQPVEACLLEGRVVVVAQVVDPDHAMAVGQEALRHVVTDEPGGAGEEDAHALKTLSRPSRTSRVALRVSTTSGACRTTCP